MNGAPERCHVDTLLELSDIPHSDNQWQMGEKTTLMASNITLLDLHLGHDSSLHLGPVVALDVARRASVDCDEPGLLLESPMDSWVMPYLEPSWLILTLVPKPSSAPPPSSLGPSVISNCGGVGGPLGYTNCHERQEEDTQSMQDPSVPVHDTIKKQEMNKKCPVRAGRSVPESRRTRSYSFWG